MEEFTLIKKPPKKEIKKMILEAGFIDCSDGWGSFYTLPCLEKYHEAYLIELRTIYADIATKVYIDPDEDDPLDRIGVSDYMKINVTLLTPEFLADYCKKVRNGIKRKEIEMIIGKETIDE